MSMHRFPVNPRQTYSERMIQARGDLRRMVKEKLCEITNDPNAQMKWTRRAYMKDVVNRYHVRIEGWPLADVPFKNLSDVTNLPKLDQLARGWRDGSIRFVQITEQQYREMVADPSPWVGAEEAGGGEPEHEPEEAA